MSGAATSNIVFIKHLSFRFAFTRWWHVVHRIITLIKECANILYSLGTRVKVPNLSEIKFVFYYIHVLYCLTMVWGNPLIKVMVLTNQTASVRFPDAKKFGSMSMGRESQMKTVTWTWPWVVIHWHCVDTVDDNDHVMALTYAPMLVWHAHLANFKLTIIILLV